MYRKMGMKGCIAQNASHYIALAVELGSNPARRAAVSELLVGQHRAVYDDSTAIPQWSQLLRRVARNTP
jgi:predicted O-linked N-acetylglucosamine transferase (SPINDLY family)